MHRRGKRERWGEGLLNAVPYLQELCVIATPVVPAVAPCNEDIEGQCKDLQTEHLKEAEIELPKPRLAWNLSSCCSGNSTV